MDIIDHAQELDRKFNDKALAEVRHRRELNRMLYGEEPLVVNGVPHCISCGEEIPPERIEANPKASRCIDCQNTRDKVQGKRFK